MSFVKDTKGRLFVTPYPTEGSKSTKISHRWNDPTTWYEDSAQVTEQVCTEDTAGVDYSTGDTNIIDCCHGKIWAEDDLGKQVLVEAFEGGVWVEKTEEDPHTPGSNDFTIDYASGTINFHNALAGGTQVRASYWKAQSSVFTIAPSPGKQLTIKSAEVQFAADTILDDTVHFDVWGYVDAFAPQLLDTADPPGPYPSGTKIRIKRTSYKSLHNFIDESNGANPQIPAIGGNGWRGVQQPITVFPWDYQAAMALMSSAGMEIRINLEHDKPFGGSYATCTLYCLSENES